MDSLMPYYTTPVSNTMTTLPGGVVCEEGLHLYSSVTLLRRSPFRSDHTWQLRAQSRRWDLYGDIQRDTLVPMTRQVSSKIQEVCMRSHTGVLATAFLREANRVSSWDGRLGG